MHQHYPNIVILTGAGISAESGIRTFRAADGLWEDHRVEDVATPEGFARDPKLVQRFYNERRKHLQQPEIQPNAAHKALGELEANWPGEVLVVTQNIDDLHERGGSENLIHMHGELLRARCQACGQVHVWNSDIAGDSNCPNCGARELRPHVVWFGEMPLEMERIYDALGMCDLFVSIGTSGNVYPAAGFVAEANRAGAKTIEMNLEPSQVHSHFQQQIFGPAGETVPELVSKLLERA